MSCYTNEDQSEFRHLGHRNKIEKKNSTFTYKNMSPNKHPVNNVYSTY